MSYSGFRAQSGRSVSDAAHLAQSVGDILSTPLGSRVMRREYGSNLFELIDSAANGAGRLRLIAAAATALMRWEPRLRLSRIETSVTMQGRLVLTIFGTAFGVEQTISTEMIR